VLGSKSDGSVVLGMEIQTLGHAWNFEVFRAMKGISEFHRAM
jgi:hypothetical protein